MCKNAKRTNFFFFLKKHNGNTMEDMTETYIIYYCIIHICMVVCSLDGLVNFDLDQRTATAAAVVVVNIVFHKLSLLNFFFLHSMKTNQSGAALSGRNYVICKFILSSGNLANANHFFWLSSYYAKWLKQRGGEGRGETFLHLW